MQALIHGTLYTGRDVLTEHAILLERDRIVDVIPAAHLPSDTPHINLAGHWVAPGFIDLQLNGCGGVMFNDAITPDTLDTLHRTNLQSGTTSYLPTLITTSDADMEQAMAVVHTYRHHHPWSILGLHLEGPYLNPTRKGIHNAAYIRPPDERMLRAIAQAGRETVRLVTLAPEQATPDQIRTLTEAGIVVSAGHSDATYEAAIAGFEAGIGMATHLFNAMSPWLGRKPGLVGAVFNTPGVYAGIIADGHHVHLASLQLAHQMMGDRLVLVTDATPPVGTTMESFVIGGHEVFYRDGRCVSADGTLGGSALTLIEAIANCVRHAHIPLAEALRMASTYPARLLGLDQDLGYLAPGYLANLAVFDHTFQMRAVVDQGHWHPLSSAGQLAENRMEHPSTR